MLGEQRDVLAPRAQRRQGDDVEGEPVEEIAAEPAARAASAGRSTLARGDDAHIDRQRLVAADAGEAAILDDAQQLLLHRERGGRDLVEEERAAIGQLEARGRRRAAPVKAPASWPKSSLSSRVSASAAQLTVRNGLSQRGER